MLCQQLGQKGVFLGGLVVALLMLVQYLIGKFKKRWYKEELKNRDERVKLLHELLTGIKIVKLYGWETAFLKKVGSWLKILVT